MQLKKVRKVGGHLSKLGLVTMEKLKQIGKAKNPWVDLFYSRYLNGIYDFISH